MQAMVTERSPGLPSLMVTTRRRLMPHGTSCSFLQAVTQALHSMQRSASQRNFIRAIGWPSLRRLDLTQRRLRLLHPGDRVEAVGRHRVDALAEDDRVGALGVVRPHVVALVPAGAMEAHPSDALADPVGDQRLDVDSGLVLGTETPDPLPTPYSAVIG